MESATFCECPFCSLFVYNRIISELSNLIHQNCKKGHSESMVCVCGAKADVLFMHKNMNIECMHTGIDYHFIDANKFCNFGFSIHEIVRRGRP